MKPLHISSTITLKPLSLSDAADIFRVIDSERAYLGKWLPFVPYTKTVDDSIQFVESVLSAPEETREMVFSIYAENIFVGLIGLKFAQYDKANKRAEIGYWLSEEHQKKGIVTQSVSALLDYAFSELGLNRVQIRCAVGNIPSKNIPRRLGFLLEGIERDGELLPDNQFADIEVYSILKKEW